jgi:ATP-binding cassette, subfamily B, bacterial MsbA
MKIYLRLLGYAQPVFKYVGTFVLLSILGIVFGLLNFTLLIPVFDLLFSNNPVPTEIPVIGDFEFSIEFFKNLFYHKLYTVIQEGGKIKALYFICTILVCSVVLSNLFKYFAQRVMENWRIRTITNLRNAFFDKVLSFHLGYFTDQKKGDILSRVTGDIATIQVSLTNTFVAFIKEPLTLIAYFFALFSMSYKLTLFTLIVIPLSGFFISRLVKKLRRYANKTQNYMSEFVSNLDEALGGIRIIKAFNAKEYAFSKLRTSNYQYARSYKSMVARQQLASPVSETFGIITIAIILIYGGSLVINQSNELSPSTFIAYILLFSQILQPAKALTNMMGDLQHGIVSGERVFQILDTPNLIVDKPNALSKLDFNDKIEFKNVSFGYGTKYVLSEVNFEVPKGKTIALVGPSGGGKTTISELIPRFYDVNEGTISIDGLDIRDIKQNDLRSLMGIVNQEAILFNNSIAKNIAFGKPEASMEEIIQAAKIANAHEFIIQTEHGYDSMIGERGSKLSGGQKQRLSIARAVLKNPPILLLDEATSALDTESEKLVQDALKNLMANRTTLVIAHRLSTIQHADMILVIEKGKVKEQGTHNELIQHEKGLYKRLTQLQEFQS